MLWWIYRSLGITGIFLTVASANWNDTSTGIDLDKLQRFPLKRIHGELRIGDHATFDGIDAIVDQTEARLRGRSKTGKAWLVHLCSVCVAGVWRADLDGSGTEDYVIAGHGMWNGRLAPPYSLTILMMDADGLPVPFFTAMYGRSTGGVVKSIVDLNHDGRAGLLISSYDENVSDPRANVFGSGYWITSLFRFEHSRVTEARKKAGSFAFPFVHAWTYGPTPDPLPLKVQPPPIATYVNGPGGELTATLQKVDDWSGNVSFSPSVAACTTAVAAVVVYDRPNIRELAFPNLSDSKLADLEKRIVVTHTPVKLRDVTKGQGGYCGVGVLWAAGA